MKREHNGEETEKGAPKLDLSGSAKYKKPVRKSTFGALYDIFAAPIEDSDSSEVAIKKGKAHAEMFFDTKKEHTRAILNRVGITEEEAGGPIGAYPERWRDKNQLIGDLSEEKQKQFEVVVKNLNGDKLADAIVLQKSNSRGSRPLGKRKRG